MRFRFKTLHIPDKKNSAADALLRSPVGKAKHMEILSLSRCWLPLAQSVAEQPTPEEVEEARLMEEVVIERTLGAMIAVVSTQPMVITWECLKEEAQRDPEYKAMIEVIKNGGQGTWPAGLDGIR